MTSTNDYYLGDDEVERGILRQGDIIAGIQLVGAISYGEIAYVVRTGQPPNAWTVERAPEHGDAIVLSHDCEIDPDNAVKVTSVILAPIRDISKATSIDNFDLLRKSNLLDPNHPQPSFLKYFYLPPHQSLHYAEGAVADFSKCFSLRKGSIPSLVAKKAVQLQPDIAKKLALKLAAYYYRG